MAKRQCFHCITMYNRCADSFEVNSRTFQKWFSTMKLDLAISNWNFSTKNVIKALKLLLLYPPWFNWFIWVQVVNEIFFCKSLHICWTWCEKCGQNGSVGKMKLRDETRIFTDWVRVILNEAYCELHENDFGFWMFVIETYCMLHLLRTFLIFNTTQIFLTEAKSISTSLISVCILTSHKILKTSLRKS